MLLLKRKIFPTKKWLCMFVYNTMKQKTDYANNIKQCKFSRFGNKNEKHVNLEKG